MKNSIIFYDIEIDDFYEPDSNFSTINLSFQVTKGNTSKRAIYIYAKTGRYFLTEKKTFYIYEKNVRKHFSLALRLKDKYGQMNQSKLLEVLNDSILHVEAFGENYWKSLSEELRPLFLEKSLEEMNLKLKNNTFPGVSIDGHDGQTLAQKIYCNDSIPYKENLRKNKTIGKMVNPKLLSGNVIFQTKTFWVMDNVSWILAGILFFLNVIFIWKKF